MKTSDDGVTFIADQEGFVPHVYRDFANVATIGFGHAIQLGETFGIISRDQGVALLRVDLAVAENAVSSNATVDLLQHEFDALVSLAFNIGGAAFKSSTVLRLLNMCDREGAADAFLMWNKATIRGVLRKSDTLDRRRRLERAMFLGGDECPTDIA